MTGSPVCNSGCHWICPHANRQWK